jgi:hypothetical protein
LSEQFENTEQLNKYQPTTQSTTTTPTTPLSANKEQNHVSFSTPNTPIRQESIQNSTLKLWSREGILKKRTASRNFLI